MIYILVTATLLTLQHVGTKHSLTTNFKDF